MIQLNTFQYPALRAFSKLVKRELEQNHNKQISPTTVFIGQEYGFCKDEIREIVDHCYEELPKAS